MDLLADEDLEADLSGIVVTVELQDRTRRLELADDRVAGRDGGKKRLPSVLLSGSAVQDLAPDYGGLQGADRSAVGWN